MCVYSYSQVYLNQVRWVACTVHLAETKTFKELRKSHLTKRGFNTLQIEKRLDTIITGLSIGLWHAHDKKTDAPRLMMGFRSDDHVVGRKSIVNTRRLPTSIIHHSTLLFILVINQLNAQNLVL